LAAYIRASWDDAQKFLAYVEAVHRLGARGAVFTQAACGVSQEGFDAEWREIILTTVDGDRIDRVELFDEADLDAALARFEELSPPPPRRENAATQVVAGYTARFAARDWGGLAHLIADDISTEDRRRAANAGRRHGRAAEIANIRAVADVGITHLTFAVIAVRGERLVLAHASGGDDTPQGFAPELLGVFEIGSDNQIATIVLFDLEDFDAAIAELDARYLAGEAAAHARTWSAITDNYAAFNRYEPPTVDWINIDHRRGMPFATSDLDAALRSFWDLTPEFKIQIEAVHRLSDFGAVITHYSHGSSPEGVEVEWRMIQLLMVEGDRITRCELFDEDDLDAALARFEELQSRKERRLHNVASQVCQRFLARFAVHDWDAMADIWADDYYQDDHRSIVNAGIRHGRDAALANMRAVADLDITDVDVSDIATRGEHLILTRSIFSFRDQGPEAFVAEQLDVGEINSEGRLAASVSFDCDDFEAAIAELDARYLAGEAAAYARTWSAIARGFTALSRGETPQITGDFVDVDHRALAPIGQGDLLAYLRVALADTMRDVIYIEAVHRLTHLGAVVTHVAKGTSRDGLDVEWRVLDAVTIDGDMFSRCEMFDEDDLDAALARFDELSRSTPQH